MIRAAFLCLNAISMVVFLFLAVAILYATFLFETVGYEDNFFMLIYATCLFLLPLMCVANFLYFYKNREPDRYLFIVPVTLAVLSCGNALISLQAEWVDFLNAMIASAILILPLTNVLLLKRLTTIARKPVDVSVFN